MPLADEHTSHSTSASLLRRVFRLDPDAWRRFSAIYTPLVYTWARRGGLQEADAADVVQEVFQTVARKRHDIGKGRENASFRGWLFAVTRNQVRLMHRRRSGQPLAAGGSGALKQLADAPAPGEIDFEEAPDDRRYLLFRTLEAIRADFEPRTWEAFWMMVVGGRTAEEIAQSLGMTATSVRQAKFRVLCRLREEVDGQ